MSDDLPELVIKGSKQSRSLVTDLATLKHVKFIHYSRLGDGYNEKYRQSGKVSAEYRLIEGIIHSFGVQTGKAVYGSKITDLTDFSPMLSAKVLSPGDISVIREVFDLYLPHSYEDWVNLTIDMNLAEKFIQVVTKVAENTFAYVEQFGLSSDYSAKELNNFSSVSDSDEEDELTIENMLEPPYTKDPKSSESFSAFSSKDDSIPQRTFTNVEVAWMTVTSLKSLLLFEEMGIVTNEATDEIIKAYIAAGKLKRTDNFSPLQLDRLALVGQRANAQSEAVPTTRTHGLEDMDLF